MSGEASGGRRPRPRAVRAWTKDDLSAAEALLAAARIDGRSFAAAFDQRELELRSSDLTTLPALMILVMENVLRQRWPATRWGFRKAVDTHALLDRVETLADPTLVDLARARAMLQPSARHDGARGLGLGNVPLTMAGLYTVAVCCNVAIDESLQGAWVNSYWRKRYRITARIARRRFATTGSS